MDNRVLRALERFICATDEVLARLGEDLNGHIVGDESFLDNRAYEVEVSLRRRRETHLDFLVPHPHERFEHHALAFGAHRVNESLVSVAKIDGTPPGCRGNRLRRPRAVGKVDGRGVGVRAIAVNRKVRRLLIVDHGVLLVVKGFGRAEPPRRVRPES